MKRFFAKTMDRIKPSELGRIWQKASDLESAGRRIRHFEIGRPDFDTPEPVKEAAIAAIHRGDVHYTVPRGLIQLREAIAADMETRLGLTYDPATEITVTIGAVEGITDFFMTVLNPGDEILIFEPMYLFYLEWGEFLGAKTVPIPVTAESGFQATEEEILAKVTDRTKVIIINTPHNPTGAGFRDETLEAIARVAIKHDLLVVSDEVYDRLVYGSFVHRSIAGLEGMKERTLVVNSFSKPFAMDGWRVGYSAAPAELIEQMDKAHLRSSTCASSIAQHAAVEALKHGQVLVEPMVEEYRTRQELILQMVDERPGFSIYRPQGAFYLWLDFGGCAVDDWTLTEILLEEAGVSVTPGLCFGPSGRGHYRISYATELSQIEEGLPRMLETIDRHR